MSLSYAASTLLMVDFSHEISTNTCLEAGPCTGSGVELCQVSWACVIYLACARQQLTNRKGVSG